MTEPESPSGPRPPSGPPPRPLVLYAFLFLGGLSTMGVELTAVRLLAPHFGTSTIIWTNVICVILVALSLGFAAGGAIADRKPSANVLSLFALSGGLLLFAVPAIGPWVATVAVPQDVPIEAARSSLLVTSLLVAVVLFGSPIFLLGATSPLAYKLLVSDMPRVGRRIGCGAMVSTLGGIAGTYLPTLWFIPAFGTRKTIWIFAGIAILAGLLVRFGTRRALGAALAAFASLPFADGSPGRIEPAGRGSIVEERETRYQYLAVRDDGEGTLTLTANEGRFGYQSAYRKGEWLTGGKYFDCFSLFASAAAPPEAPLRVLILGFAGGTIARQIHHFFATDERSVRIDGVEIDPEAVEMGRRHLGFELGTGDGIRVFHEDARTFVNRRPGPYDLVIVDVYAHDVYIPFHVASLEFFRSVGAALAPRGLLVINASFFTLDAEPLRLLENTVAVAFGSVARYPIEFTQNVLLVASHGRSLDPTEADGPNAPVTPDGLSAERKRFRSDRLTVRGPAPGLDALTDDHSPLEIETEKLLRNLSRSLGKAGR